jgi:tetratricopeptide (TPR) repeat protein
MVADNLRLFLKLYTRPRAALAEIVDDGSLLVGAGLVLIVSIGLEATSGGLMYRLMAEQLEARSASIDRPRAQPPATVIPATPNGFGVEALPRSAELDWRFWLWSTMASSTWLTVIGLAALFVPAIILLLSVLAPVGSVGVIFRRDYGSLATCAFMSWTAAYLPTVVLSLPTTLAPVDARTAAILHLVLRVLSWSAFVLLTTVALRIVLPVGFALAAAAVMAGSLALLLKGLLAYLASPFALYFLYLYLRSDIGDIQWSLGARRSFKRHLETLTLNPRDSDAHYQLALIYQRRGQLDEASARFGKAVEISPREVDAHYQLGRIARQKKRPADAVRHFEDVVQRDPSHARHEIWREVGGTYLEVGQLENARDMLTRFVDNRPYDPEGLYALGLAHRELGDKERAAELFRRCVEAARTTPHYRQHEVRRWRSLAEKQLAD